MEDNGDQETTSFCSCSSINGELSEAIADILEAVIGPTGTKEVINTDDLLAMVDETAENILELRESDREEIFVGNLNVKRI